MNRVQFQQLAELRVVDAQALISAGCWSGAHYLAGYAVECGLKACVLARVERTGVIFEDRRFSERCWTHRPEELIKLADLESVRGMDASGDPAFAANWLTVEAWSETSRYENKTQAECQQLVAAITDPVHGVLPWIRKHW